MNLPLSGAFSPLWRSLTSQHQHTLRVLRGGQEAAIPPVEPQSQSQSSNSNRALSEQTTTPVATLAAFFVNLGSLYTKQLESRPILTKSSTAGIIFALSDYLAQRIEQKNDKKKPALDRTRLLASTLVGFLYFGPAAHYWYEWIFRLLPGTGIGSTVQKALLGQLIFGPSFTCVFFATSLLQAGEFSLAAWGRKIREDLPGAWLAGVGFWPLVDLISYSVIPVIWIPLFINLCSLVWTIYLSLVANKGNSQKKK